MSLDAAIVALIRSCESASEIHQGRIFFGLIPEQQALPAVSYFRIGSTNQDEPIGKGSRIKITEYQVRAVGDDHTTTERLATALESCLHDAKGNYSGVSIQGSEVTGRLPDFENNPGYFGEILTVNLYHRA